MAKPGSLPQLWASDATFSTGPEAGSNTKVARASFAQGFVPGQAFVGPHVNYEMNLYAQWVAYLNALHSETEFLNKTYSFTARQEISAEVNSPNQVLSVSNSGGTGLAGFFSASTTTTVLQVSQVSSGSSITGLGGPIDTDDEYRYTSARTRKKLVPLRYGDTWVRNVSSAGLRTTTPSGGHVEVFEMPDGAIVTQMRVLAFLSDAASSTGLSVSLRSYRIDDTDPRGSSTLNTGSELGNVTITAASTSSTDLSLGTDASISAHTHDADRDEYRLYIIACDTISTNNTIHWVELTYTIPGPPER